MYLKNIKSEEEQRKNDLKRLKRHDLSEEEERRHDLKRHNLVFKFAVEEQRKRRKNDLTKIETQQMKKPRKMKKPKMKMKRR